MKEKRWIHKFKVEILSFQLVQFVGYGKNICERQLSVVFIFLCSAHWILHPAFHCDDGVNAAEIASH